MRIFMLCFSDFSIGFLEHEGIYSSVTQGRIARYHRTMKDLVKLLNYCFPGELEVKIEMFVDYYNNGHYH